MLRRSLALVAASLAVLAVAAPAHAARWVAGSSGSGDPFFPLAGNGGYDVRHYSLRLRYERASNHLAGHALVFARATGSLSRFNLDLRDFLRVSSVKVNGRRAYFTHAGQELSITPRAGLRAGTRFVVSVRYAGTPEPIVDPVESIEGWIPTEDGAFVVNEPQGSPGWYPVNDTPRDKATYDFRVTVPAGHAALAGGVLVSRRERGDTTTWRWLARTPTAPYLATATNGLFETRFGRLGGGLPEYNAVDPQTRPGGATAPDPALAWERLARQPEVVDFFSDLCGRYPFESVGAIVDWAPNVFYSLESQTKPNYWRVPSVSTLVHEIAHQWFGNSVTLSYWPDIWLNEGFATWSEWIYDERHGGPTAQQAYEERCAYAPGGEDYEDLWSPAPANLPGPEAMFHTPPYDRGAMTLQVLRRRVGDAVLMRILRRWYRENRGGNVTTADFIALSERVSRRELSGFFEDWLYEDGRPTRC